MKILTFIAAIMVCITISGTAQTITRDDLRKTVEHMQALVHAQANELQAAKDQNEVVINRLAVVDAEARSLAVKAQQWQAQADKDLAARQNAETKTAKIKATADSLARKLNTLCFALALTSGLLAFSALSRVTWSLPAPLSEYTAWMPIAGGVSASVLVFSLLRFAI